jgi:hypothetical protein
MYGVQDLLMRSITVDLTGVGILGLDYYFNELRILL